MTTPRSPLPKLAAATLAAAIGFAALPAAASDPVAGLAARQQSLTDALTDRIVSDALAAWTAKQDRVLSGRLSAAMAHRPAPPRRLIMLVSATR